VKLSLYASINRQLGGHDLLIEQHFLTIPVYSKSFKSNSDFEISFDAPNGALLPLPTM
jgi:hypothetical protein